jgi:hypothetical protein
MRVSLRTLIAAVGLWLMMTGCAHQVKVNPPPRIMQAQVDLSLCPLGIDGSATQPLSPARKEADGACTAGSKNGYPIPDPACTPGAVNPTLTLSVLTDKNFRTGCIRNHLTSEEAKGATYAWYGLQKPSGNAGQSQVCELDHLVPLYFGGADSLDNIWPQCGPDAVTLNERYFKQKDKVEVYVGNMVRAGTISLTEAQRGIAKDWTQYLPSANAECARTGCPSPEKADFVE